MCVCKCVNVCVCHVSECVCQRYTHARARARAKTLPDSTCFFVTLLWSLKNWTKNRMITFAKHPACLRVCMFAQTCKHVHSRTLGYEYVRFVPWSGVRRSIPKRQSTPTDAFPVPRPFGVRDKVCRAGRSRVTFARDWEWNQR